MARHTRYALLIAAAAALQAPQRRRTAVKMAAVPPGGRVLAVGNGPVFLLAAKTAAKMGYKTTIVSAREELFTQLLWSEAREEPRDPNLTVLGRYERRRCRSLQRRRR